MSAIPPFKADGFIKSDNGKPELSALLIKGCELVPPLAYAAFVRVLAFGAKKYAPDNWRKCSDPRRYWDAAARHLSARIGGEVNDSETGEPHLAAVMCCAAFALELDTKP